MAGAHSPMDQFKIGFDDPIIPLHVLGFDLHFTKSSLFMMLALGIIVALTMCGSRGRSLIPGRMQSLLEMMYQMVAGTIKDTVGDKGRPFFPLVFCLFMFVLFCNLLGMMPYGFTVTSHIAVTFGLAMLVFCSVIIIGFAKHGVKFLGLFVPHGVPGAIMPLIILLEVISFMVRPVTLSMRLAANMIAGHILLKVLAGFVVSLAAGATLPVSAVSLGLMTVFSGFEFFVAALQAYIFAVLTCVYLNDAINLH